MELAKIFCFTKDEHKLMKYWLPYHGNLFGYENIYLCDHGSSKPTLDVYEKYKKKGIHIKDCSNVKFIMKWKILSRWMREFQTQTSWLIPLDSDEFIVSMDGKNISTDPTQIKNYLGNLVIHNRKYKFQNFVGVPEQYEYKEPLLEIEAFFNNSDGNSKKSFFPGKYFVHTDQGNHSGMVKADEILPPGKPKTIGIISDLALLHFEMVGHKQIVAKFERGLAAYNKNVGGKQPLVGRIWWHRLGKIKDKKIGLKRWWDNKVKKQLSSPRLIRASHFAEALKKIKGI
jgi:hypothetical protein